jgi:hypothetical protein
MGPSSSSHFDRAGLGAAAVGFFSAAGFSPLTLKTVSHSGQRSFFPASTGWDRLIFVAHSGQV